MAAATLLGLALAGAGCRVGAEARARLVVLVDHSLSMRAGGPDGDRAAAAAAWLDGPEFARWSRGWSVVGDSFGGAATDVGRAVEARAAELPGAILVVSDGRAAGGRAAEPVDVPLYAFAPRPVDVADAAVLELAVVADSAGRPAARIALGAVGGRAVPGPRTVELLLDGRPVGTAGVGALEAGARREVRLPLPAGAADPGILRARLVGPADALADNDERSLVWRPAGPRRTLLVGLRPGWEYAALRRALAGAAAPLDAFWTAAAGELRPIDGGRRRVWGSLDPARYATAWLVGDPALLGPGGRAWLERFAAAGGHGLAWAPEGYAGTLAGAGATVPAGPRSAGRPAQPTAGRAWLAARGAAPDSAPDGGSGWPPLEGLPPAVRPPAGATPLVTVGHDPVAWVDEAGATRRAVLLGTGWYRWSIDAAGKGPAASAFWVAWSDALARWLSSSAPVERRLVTLPADGRVPRGERLTAPLAPGASGAVEWRVEARQANGSWRGVSHGRVAPDAAPRAVQAGPLAAGDYRLTARAAGVTFAEPFVVESWTPDVAWTEADTASLAAAALASGGALLERAPATPLPPAGANAASAGRLVRLGTTPWPYLAAALLLLLDWGLTGRALAWRRTRG